MNSNIALRILPFTRRDIALHLARDIAQAMTMTKDGKMAASTRTICRGYCTNYNKVKFTLSKSEKFTARKSRTTENFGGTYCIFSSVNGNKYMSSWNNEKGILSLFFGTQPEAFYWGQK